MTRVESKELKILGKEEGSASEGICRQAWLLKSDPWDPHGGRRKPIKSFLSTATGMVQFMCPTTSPNDK